MAAAPSSSSLSSSSAAAVAASHGSSTGSRAFSTTAARPATRLRRQFLQWVERFGPQYRDSAAVAAEDRGPRYVAPVSWAPPEYRDARDQQARIPFPQNPAFRSEPVLSERARETIWRAVMQEGAPLKAVSARFGVDMRRVAAVVRMKEIEKRWIREVSFLFFFFVLLLHWACVMIGKYKKKSISLEDAPCG